VLLLLHLLLLLLLHAADGLVHLRKAHGSILLRWKRIT
jgi:hypothetical protein